MDKPTREEIQARLDLVTKIKTKWYKDAKYQRMLEIELWSYQAALEKLNVDTMMDELRKEWEQAETEQLKNSKEWIDKVNKDFEKTFDKANAFSHDILPHPMKNGE